MTARAVLFAVGSALLAVPAARGQVRDVPVLPQVEPDDVRRAADWLQAHQGKDEGLGRLAKQIEALRKQDPNATSEQIAQRLLQENPQLHNPAQRQRLEQWLKQWGNLNPGGGPGLPNGPVPNNPGGPPRPVTGQSGGERLPLPVPPPPDRERRANGPRPGGEGPMPPQGDPNLPPASGRPDDPILLPENWKPPRDTNPAASAPRERYEKAAQFWETNVGPLRDTPAVRQILLEMFTGQDASDPNSTLSGIFDAASDGGEGLFRTADSALPSGWKMPDLGGAGKWNFGPPPGPSESFGLPPSTGGGSFSGFSGGGASWAPVVVLGVVAAVGLILWWVWPYLTRAADSPRPLPGLGPWPVDPRGIADREALVRAFEYLSVLVCGGDARVWNHLTIADELRRAVPDAAGIADPLARLYEVARYTPADEPLPPGAIADARGYLCRLAGVAA